MAWMAVDKFCVVNALKVGRRQVMAGHWVSNGRGAGWGLV